MYEEVRAVAEGYDEQVNNKTIESFVCVGVRFCKKVDAKVCKDVKVFEEVCGVVDLICSFQVHTEVFFSDRPVLRAIFVSFGLAKERDECYYLRFDDTNPEAEKKEYIDHIKEIVQLVGLGTFQ
ncbi:hypothetical protein IFM89_021919, partial [Coptis chinensis]